MSNKIFKNSSKMNHFSTKIQNLPEKNLLFTHNYILYIFQKPPNLPDSYPIYINGQDGSGENHLQGVLLSPLLCITKYFVMGM